MADRRGILIEKLEQIMSEEFLQVGNPLEELSVLATPLTGHTADEILETLQQHAVKNSSLLTESIVSTRAPRHVLQKLKAIAQIEPKVRHSMHKKG